MCVSRKETDLTITLVYCKNAKMCQTLKKKHESSRKRPQECADVASSHDINSWVSWLLIWFPSYCTVFSKKNVQDKTVLFKLARFVWVSADKIAASFIFFSLYFDGFFFFHSTTPSRSQSLTFLDRAFRGRECLMILRKHMSNLYWKKLYYCVGSRSLNKNLIWWTWFREGFVRQETINYLESMRHVCFTK